MKTAAKGARGGWFFLFWALAAACPVLGCVLDGAWPWAGLPLALAVAWIASGRRGADACLVATVLFDAVGILLGLSPGPLIAGAGASLALWDRAISLYLPRAPRKGGARGRIPGAIAAPLAGTAAALGATLHMALPFYAMLALAIAAALGLDRAARLLAKRGRPDR